MVLIAIGCIYMRKQKQNNASYDKGNVQKPKKNVSINIFIRSIWHNIVLGCSSYS